MTTISQLTRVGKAEFIPTIENLGFKHYGKLVFAREVGDGVHQVLAAELSYGENLKFIVTCFVEEFEPNYMKNYPMNIPITSGGDLGEGLISGELWDVESIDDIDGVFRDVVRNFREHALPWFKSVKSREDYVRVIYPHLKEKLEEQSKLNLVLNGDG